jgi:hypothetical protein
MALIIAAVFVLLVLLLLPRLDARANPKDWAKEIRFPAAIALAVMAAALAARGRIGLALLGAAGAWGLLAGTMRRRLPSPPGGGGSGGGSADGPSQDYPRGRRAGMSRAEALEVLGLQEGASHDEVRSAHRRLIVRSHPDKGGSDYLAAMINEAKDVLLRH